jgi:hypothetical protein
MRRTDDNRIVRQRRVRWFDADEGLLRELGRVLDRFRGCPATDQRAQRQRDEKQREGELNPPHGETIDARRPLRVAACSVGEAQCGDRTLGDGLLHAIAVRFGPLVVVDRDDAVILYLEDVVGDRFADPVARALVQIDFHLHEAVTDLA